MISLAKYVFFRVYLSRKSSVLSLLSSAFIFQLPLEICNLPLASCLPLEKSCLPPPANGSSPTQVIACKISSQLLQISKYLVSFSKYPIIQISSPASHWFEQIHCLDLAISSCVNLWMKLNHFVVLSIMKCHNTKCLRLRSVSISSAVEKTEAIYFQASVLVEEVSQRKSVNHLFPSLAGWQDPLSLSQRLKTRVF